MATTERPQLPPQSENEMHGATRVVNTSIQHYTLNKWRFPGVCGLVLLNIVGGLVWPWFGAISAQTAIDFQISVTQVNWLGNVINLVFLPSSLATPFLCRRYGLRSCCFMAALLLIVSGWVRYASTASHLCPRGAYALLLLGQMLAGVGQPVFQVVGPRFSEAWFDFNGRTTATMIISVANPVGSALGQLIPPLVSTPRFSILVLGIISTAVFPATFLIYSKPPHPPTFAGSLTPPPPLSTIRSLINLPRGFDKSFSLRTRADFAILTFAFSTFVAAANGLSLLTAQLFGPYGYSPSQSGLFGAALILTGLIAAIISAPLFDRVFTRHTTITFKLATPLLALSWLSMIWAVRAHNVGGIFTIMAVIGIISFMLLPLSLEMACELSMDSETSSAILWAGSNLLTIIFVEVEHALAAGPGASPPYNMQKSSIFGAVFGCTAAAVFIIFYRGLMDSRRALDAAKENEEKEKNDINHVRQV